MQIFSTLRQDIVFALRTFGKNRGFTAAVAVSIGLGIAANTTVFTVVNAMLLGDLPVRAPDRLVSLGGGRSFAWPDYLDYRDQGKAALEGLTAYFVIIPASVGGAGEPERVWGQAVAGNYFSLLGVPMQLGRGILPDEDAAAGRNPVVVLSDGLWKRRFAADANIAGKDILLNNTRYTVVGVTAPEFHGADRGLVPEFWAPLAMIGQLMPDLPTDQLKEKRDAQWVMLIGRLRPGVSRAQATAALNAIKRRIDGAYRKGEKLPPLTLAGAGGLPGGLDQGALGIFVVFSVVVGLVLLIACVNVASLLLARATTRRREIGIRLSVGASRWRLVRQLLTESVLLSLMGATLGFAMAWMATSAIAEFRLPLPIPIAFVFRPDLRVVLFTAVLAVGTGIVFGLVPALRATRPDLTTWLKNEAGGLGGLRRFGLRNALVLVQVSLSLVLLVCAGLFLRSLQNASSIDLGMRTGGVTLMAFDPKLNHYSPEKSRQFLAQVRERVSAMPGVRSVSFVDSIPLSMGGVSLDVDARGKDGAKRETADVYTVGAQYFETMGIPVSRGREFAPHSDSGATAVLNEELARRLFPGRNPLGQQISVDGLNGKKQYEVVGVVRNTKSKTLGEASQPCLYLYLEPNPEQAMSFFGISVIARGSTPPGQLEHAVREQLRALDPNLPVFNIETMNEHVNKSMLLPKLCATLLGVFGLVGVVLATLGLYGVMSYAARARTKEIGIRLAVGAQPRGILRMVAGQGLLLAGIGVAAGLAISFGVSRFTASLLYGVSATDALTFFGVPTLMLAVALVAVLIPALRAARVDPLEALHYE
ncbi:MAG: ABC transporter permease [Bryobacteraceae bacterium]|jgi:predicted permease